MDIIRDHAAQKEMSQLSKEWTGLCENAGLIRITSFGHVGYCRLVRAVSLEGALLPRVTVIDFPPP